VNVDEERGSPDALHHAVNEIRDLKAIREAWVVRL
jgi:hypothetical protein